MAKVKITGVGELLKSIDKVFKTTIEKKETYQEILDFTAERIVQQTRTGKQLPKVVNGKPQGETGTQPPLSKGYVSYRQRLAKEGFASGLGETFKPKKSNLTFTGQLLDSIKGTYKKGVFKNTMVIEPTGKRDDGKSNKDVVTDLANRTPSRRFLGLDQKGFERIRLIVLGVLRRNIRNFNK